MATASRVKFKDSIERSAYIDMQGNGLISTMRPVLQIIERRREVAMQLLKMKNENDIQMCTDLLNEYNKNLCELLAIPEPKKIEDQDL